MSEESSLPNRPQIETYLHCDAVSGRPEEWRERAEAALSKCLENGARLDPQPLSELALIEISLVTDAAIAAVHGEFMDDPTPTDVITFQHGEILVSAETAARCAPQHGHPPEREAWLYLIHGLLHLNGYDDTTESARREMEAIQNRILNEVSPFLPG
jgi:probable rRNA maturation factor